MQEFQMSKQDLLNKLYDKNYRIIIKVKNGSKFAKFTHPLAISSSKASHCYSMQWSNEEIKRDLAYDLLRWSGLKINWILD